MKKLTLEQVKEIETKIRRLENDPKVTKHELRLFMQDLMPCGHSVGNLLTCAPPIWMCNLQ